MDARRLTVLQVLPALESGGVERGTLEVAAELVRRGHRSLVMSGGGRLVEPLERAGSRHLQWPIGRKSLRTLGLVRPLRRLLAQERVDIVHVRSRVPGWIVWRALQGMAPESRPALVTTVHGPYSKPWYSVVMVRGARIIAVSETIRDYIRANYPRVDMGRVRVIHRGVDRGEFPYGYRPPPAWLAAWAGDHPALAGRFVITLPARVTRWKGQEDLLRIVALLKQRGVPVHGLVAGGCEPRREEFLAELRAEAARLGLEHDVTFLGHRSDLREVMAVSNVVLSLSREPEAFGRTTIEALSLGVPVAGYDHGGVGEQLREVLPAGRIPPGDVEAAVDLLAGWHASPPAVPAGHRFTRARMLDETLRVYAEVAGP
ncbi:glycosyltransferase family 4 protein [Thioalbus denitrificans]|uniref:Glycosyltransferase involved in cell wall biosynthesis n=1 Tax=Thioalbus denitrificans TaxID=547122 RepID=A0A369C0J3_9GAMM|nr:glycosyltransferase family 4 protein [Thioalbus denitrificans]RCX26187.1 glycosyltransferase involved in cell wall biosynthesis [Thioalbus denitrificans]